jgi:cytochrome c biogenesis protein CcmG, thiol:disulfide interchange protein DsbE
VKKTLLILAAAAILLAGIILRHPSTANKEHARQLQPAPDFSLSDLSGQKLALSTYRGKVVLLDFWATWCDPCKAEIPHFVEMQNGYGAQGLQVIGISMDDDEQLARDFRQQYKMNYPVAMGNPQLAEQYGGILGLPITFTIDREGRIVSRHIGATDPSVFEAEIEKLLSTP